MVVESLNIQLFQKKYSYVLPNIFIFMRFLSVVVQINSFWLITSAN